MDALLATLGAKACGLLLSCKAAQFVHPNHAHATSFEESNEEQIGPEEVQITMMYRDAGIKSSDIAKRDGVFTCKGRDTQYQREQDMVEGSKTYHPNMKFYSGQWDGDSGTDKMNYKLVDMDTGDVLWDASFKRSLFSEDLGNTDKPLEESLQPYFKKMCVTHPGEVKLYDFSAGPSNVVYQENMFEKYNIWHHTRQHDLSKYLFDRSFHRYPHRVHEIVAVTKLYPDPKGSSPQTSRLSNVYKYREHMFDPPSEWKDIQLADGRYADPYIKKTARILHRDRGLTTPWRIMVRKGEYEENQAFPDREKHRNLAQYVHLAPDNRVPPEQMLALGKVGMLPTKARLYDHDQKLWEKLDPQHMNCGLNTLEHPGRDYQERFPEAFGKEGKINPDDIHNHCFNGYYPKPWKAPFNWFDLFPEPNEVLHENRDLAYFAGHHAADPPIEPAAEVEDNSDNLPEQMPWRYDQTNVS